MARASKRQGLLKRLIDEIFKLEEESRERWEINYILSWMCSHYLCPRLIGNTNNIEGPLLYCKAIPIRDFFRNVILVEIQQFASVPEEVDLIVLQLLEELNHQLAAEIQSRYQSVELMNSESISGSGITSNTQEI